MKLRDFWPMAITFPLLFLPWVGWSMARQAPEKMTEVDGRVVDVREVPCILATEPRPEGRRCYVLGLTYASDLTAQHTFEYRHTRFGEVHVGDHLPVLVRTAQPAEASAGAEPDQPADFVGTLTVFALAIFARGCLATWHRIRRRRTNYRALPA